MKVVHCPALLWGNYWLLMDVEGRFLQHIPTGEPTNLHGMSITSRMTMVNVLAHKRKQKGSLVGK